MSTWLDFASQSHTSGDNLDGGNFTDYNSGDNIDGGTFLDMERYHHIYALNQSTIGTDDVVITGIQVKAQGIESDYGETVLFGTTGYVIEITNPLIQENTANTIANSVGAKIVGMRFRPLSISALSDPSIEAGDVAYVSDRKGNSYQTLITNLSYNIGNTESISCDAETPSKKQSVRFDASTKAIVEARKIAKQEISQYDLVVKQFQNLMTYGFGLYPSEEVLEDGSTIYYMHDKPTIAESNAVWKFNENGLFLSTDNGLTWGVDTNGNMLVNVLTAVGINADWIIAGLLASKNNSSWFDLDNNSFSYGNGALTYSLANGFRINTPNTTLINGNLTANNIKGSNVDLSGKITATSGSFTGTITSQNANITGGTINIVTADATTNKIVLSSSGYKMDMSPYKMNYSDGSNASVMQGITISNEFVTGHTVGGSRNFVLSTSSTCSIDRGLQVSGKLLAYNDFECKGTKNRIVKTKNYGEVLLNAYETPRPTFADTGHGTIGEDGLCYVEIDSIFFETIDTTHDYRYFLTKYGQGDLWVDKALSTKEYFVVKGTANLEFDWKIEAIQRDYNIHNLEKFENSINEEMESDYTSLASNYLEEYEKELILC